MELGFELGLCDILGRSDGFELGVFEGLELGLFDLLGALEGIGDELGLFEVLKLGLGDVVLLLFGNFVIFFPALLKIGSFFFADLGCDFFEE